MTSPADTLRIAADKLHALAMTATHEDRTTWTPGHTKGSLSAVVIDDPERPSVLIETWAPRLEAVNDYIAAMNPATGLALADWMENVADRVRKTGEEWVGADLHHALAVARQVLGSDQ